MTKVLVIDTKTEKERLVSRREAAVFAKLLPRGRYLTRDMVAQSAAVTLQPREMRPVPSAASAEAAVASAAPTAEAPPEPAKKKPGRPKKTEQQ